MSETQTTEVTEEIPGNVKLEILSSLNVEPMTTPMEVIAKLYREQVSIIDEHNEKLRKGSADDDVTKAAKSQFVENDPILDDILAEMADKLFSYVSANPASALVAHARAKNFVDAVNEEKKYRLDAAIREAKQKFGQDSTQSEVAQDAYTAHLVLLDLLNMRKGLVEAGYSQENISSLMSETKGGKRRFVSDSVPNKRNLDDGSGIRNKGRNAKASRVQFVWTTSEGNVTLPIGTTLADIAHTCVSQGSYRVSVSDLDDAIKAQGDKVYTPEGDSIRFSTGTLSGRLVS